MSNKYYAVVGMMSGTSLDGIDLIMCKFQKSHHKWKYQIVKAVTYGYTMEWKNKLNEAAGLDAGSFLLLHQEYGSFIGEQVNRFLSESGLNADLVASHGHTIFHQPDKGFTFQLGSGAALASKCKLDTVWDFRTMDVALGGQGAPLVPLGDELLFGRYKFCLNLGGFANVSSEEDGQRVAFDICPVNIVLNHLAGIVGKPFDRSGEMARIGIVSETLLNSLDHLSYYSQKPPKSLGKEWVLANIHPLLDQSSLRLNDLMSTFCEHIAMQIGRATEGSHDRRILVTGGGAGNDFLVERIKTHNHHQIVIPDEYTVNFKEALIFAFLGVLRWREEINCLGSATGASYDSIGGTIYLNH